MCLADHAKGLVNGDEIPQRRESDSEIQKRNAVRDRSRLWRTRVIPYKIDKSLSKLFFLFIITVRYILSEWTNQRRENIVIIFNWKPICVPIFWTFINVFESPLSFLTSDRLMFSGGNAERMIQWAISDFHRKTCIKFVHSTGSDYYIRFVKGHGCVFFIVLTMMRSD